MASERTTDAPPSRWRRFGAPNLPLSSQASQAAPRPNQAACIASGERSSDATPYSEMPRDISHRCCLSEPLNFKIRPAGKNKGICKQQPKTNPVRKSYFGQFSCRASPRTDQQTAPDKATRSEAMDVECARPAELTIEWELDDLEDDLAANIMQNAPACSIPSRALVQDPDVPNTHGWSLPLAMTLPKPAITQSRLNPKSAAPLQNDSHTKKNMATFGGPQDSGAIKTASIGAAIQESSTHAQELGTPAGLHAQLKGSNGKSTTLRRRSKIKEKRPRQPLKRAFADSSEDEDKRRWPLEQANREDSDTDSFGHRSPRLKRLHKAGQRCDNLEQEVDDIASSPKSHQPLAGVLNSPVLLSDDDGTANGGGAHVTCKDPVSDDELNWGDAAPITGDRRRLDRQQLGPPWWHRLPNFVPLAALKDGINPRTGAVVHIDYMAQFNDAPELPGDQTALRRGSKQTAARRKQGGRRKAPSAKSKKSAFWARQKFRKR